MTSACPLSCARSATPHATPWPASTAIWRRFRRRSPPSSARFADTSSTTAGASARRRAAAGDADDRVALFGAELDQSPARYLVGVRIETASRLLRDTSLPIGTVSLLVGYADVASFRRTFKSWFGLPPAEFRRRARSIAGRDGGAEEELLGFQFWDQLGRDRVDPAQVRRLVGWLRAVYRESG